MALIVSRRTPFLGIALACIVLLTSAYFLQFHSGLEPCPLCIFQRVFYFLIGATALIAAFHGARLAGATAYCAVIAILSVIGAIIAGRQVWLQHLPKDLVPECGPGLDFMLDMYPLGETIRKVLRGSGDCAKVDWTLLGLSLAEWSVLCFIGLMLSALGIAFLRAKQRPVRRRRSSSGGGGYA